MSFNKRLSASASLGSVSSSSNGGGGDVNGAGGGGSSSNDGNVQVVLRIRPPNDHDVSSIPARFQRIAITPSSATTVSVDSGSQVGVAPKKPQTFIYDRVLGPQEGQKELYEAAAERLVGKFMEGFNVTILAYGQTSSGKSYSMGTALDSSNTSSSTFDITPSTGLVPRAVSEIFRRCAELERLAGGKGNLRFDATNSFVELYNEDLLDLLSSTDPSIPASERPTLSIREDKEGHIIWSGLKEIKVNSKEDVMANLRSGTALRRTNETDMNAQSSRSHAIFSITLTQRRRVGGPAPPASAGSSAFPASASAPPSAFAAAISPVNSSSPAPSTPTRGIPRPSSVGPGARTMSPTPSSRPTTPSGLPMIRPPRPSSVLGLNGRAGTPVTKGEEQETFSSAGKKEVTGEWVTITSKFHFVDLAGSERLKRTSALGERLKEGISINSGLLALGNVISALGDPVKARQSTHIPYRDSKLTRLLQDSLGGNAHTLMVACVSPAEFNLTETLSTIKYANRARNIKNRAEVNELEVGWDDVEHLQASLTKLRKEHALLKAAAASAGVVGSNGSPNMDLSSIEEHPSAPAGASSRLLGQLQGLQEQNAVFLQTNSETSVEMARLNKQLEEARMSGGEGGGDSKAFAEMVGPVIAEYERAIATLEGELKLSRATLAQTNNLYNEQEIQLSEVLSRTAQTESYVGELRARVSKLVERESSTESYIRDLEVKLKNHSDGDESKATEVAELRKEIARLKESDGNSARYVADLEARLAKTDASQAALAAHVERLEKEVERREEMYRDLEARLQLVDTTKDNKLLLQELDEKDGKVAALERKLEEAIREMDVIGKERSVLQEQAKKSDGEREGLRDRLDELQASATAAKRASLTAISPHAPRALLTTANSYASQGSSAEFFTPATEVGGMDFDKARSNATTPDGPSTPTFLATSFPSSALEPPSATSEVVVNKMDAELQALQEAHSKTLESLDEISSKYRDALKEITDLHAQVQEARLLQSEADDIVPPSPRPPPSPSRSDSAGSNDFLSSSMASSDSGPLSPTAIKLGSIPRRRVTTADRKSLPPSTNGSSPPSSNNSNGSSQRDFGSRGGGLPRPMSLSQELSSSPSSRSSWAGPAVSLLNTSPTARPTPPIIKPERSVQSLENEIMSLQATLKLREEEIDQLEKNITLHVLPPRGSSLSLRSDAGRSSRSHGRSISDAKSESAKSINGSVAFPPLDEDSSPSSSLPDSPPTHTRGLSKSSSGQPVGVPRLSTSSDHSRTSEERSPPFDEEDHHKRLEELMRSMAQKESVHKETVDSMNAEIEKVRREHSDIVTLSRDQALNVSTELDGLRTKLLTAQDQHDDLSSKLEEMKRREEDLVASRQRLEETHAEEITKLRSEHEEVLSRREAEAAAILARRDESHADDLKRAELERNGVFSESQEEHVAAIAVLSDQHSERLSKRDLDHASDVATLKEEHARTLASKESESSGIVERLRSDHSTAIARLGEEKTTESERLKAALAKSRDEHVSVLQEVRTEAEAKLLAAEEQHRSSLATAHADREAAVVKIAEQLSTSTIALEAAQDSVKVLRTEHEELLAMKVQQHEVALSSLASTHRDALYKETESSQSLVAAHKIALAAEVEQRSLADSKLAEITNQNAQLQAEIISIRTSHEVEINKLQHELGEASTTVSQLHFAATEGATQKSSLQSELEALRAQLVQIQGDHKEVTTNRDSVQLDLDSHRTSLTQAQTELHRTKTEIDSLHSERVKQDAAMAELQAKLAEYSATVPEQSEPVPTIATGPRESLRDVTTLIGRAGSPSSRSSKPPPPTPPPTAPVPPLPSSLPSLPAIPDDGTTSTASRNSHNGGRTSSLCSGRRSPRSSSTSIDGGNASTPVVDPRLLAQIEEQDGQITSLNRRLNHCEADLQANIDLVNTLEAALNDSERALRKSRLSANDIAKDRDRLSAECDTLRSLLQHARAEALSLRSSQNDERGKMESQMASERRQKDTAKRELESRLEEMEKRKSKFNCF